MLLNINGVEVEVQFNIQAFVQIAQYKKFYEPKLNMTLTKYMLLVENPDYVFDLIADLIYYPHAIRSKNVGKKPELEYPQVAEWVLLNMDKLEELVRNVKQSIPQPEVSDTPVKKKVVKSKS
jgi:hypothetical protein